MAQSGIRWIQVRAKCSADGELLDLVECCGRRLEGSETVLWVNDRADIAALSGADGVHLGARDLPPGAARTVVGDTIWIGSSTHNPSQLETAEKDRDVDVVAVGPVFATQSKQDPDPVVGLRLVERARRLVTKPLVAIGGINADNAARVLAAGADTVAVIGALSHGGSIERNARRILDAIS